MPQDDLNLVQKCSVSVTSMTCSGYPSTSHHHVIHEQQSNSQGDATPSNICKGGWNPFQEDIHMVRHTTKLLKSRDSRTGRLIINQYMKGKEIGRGVHGVVYIGKNMDKVLRSNTSVQPDDKILAGSVSPGPQRLSSSLIFGNLPSSSMSATSMDTQMASLNLNDSYSQAPYYRVEDDYETVAIKVVRREPRGPKSLRRSQMQRQREREAMDDCLNCYSPSQKVNGDANGRDNRSILSPELSIGRVPLLKDVDDKLKKEIAIMKRLRHRHIVQLKEVIDDAKSKKVFMILEFMEGGQVLWQDPLHQTPLMTVEQARNTFRQVLLGLEYLHYQGIIHRDIKPANLLWTADRATVKISDFGVSHISGVLKRSASTSNLAANLAAENVSCDGPRTTNSLDDKALRKTEGSPAFMAPELCCPVEPTPVSTPPERNALDYFTHKPKSVQDHYSDNTLVHRSTFDPANAHRLISLPLSPNTFAKGQRPTVGKGIDIWALGVTLYCLLFGRTPFNAPNEYELFNVIWNEPILVPSRMGIEGQAIEFNPDSSCADGPVERDSRELVDLLRRLLDKDPRRRIQLKEVKTHPWVLNNLDNTQHWVNETAPLGCDAVHVTTEEVANFSRPRDSLKVYKPLGGVKQSLRKAAIKLGLQRSSSSKLDRLQKKSATSPNPGPLPSARRSSPPPQTYPILAARKSAPLTRRKITVDTSNLGSPDHGPLSLGNDITPVTESSDYASPYNAHTTSLLRGFGGCSEWASASTSQVSPIVVSRSSLPVPRSQPSTPTIPSAPVSERHIPELLHKPAPLNLCHSPFLSCFASSPTNDANSEILHSSVSSPRNSAVLIDSLQRSIDPHNSHLLAQPDLLPQADRIQQRRSLPTSPAPLLALVSLSRSSLAPSRTTSPIATSEGGYVKPSHHARFRDALSRVKQRFSRSRSRTGSLTTTCNETASSDLDNSQLRSEVAHDANSTHRSELFNSDAGNPRPESLREENEGDAEADEEQEEDDDIDDFSSISHEACGPLMYHDGTKWNFPRLGSHSTNEGGSEPWTSIFKSRIDDVDAPKDEEVWEGGTAGRVNQTELTPRPQNPSEYLSEEADRLRQGLVMMRSAISEWEKPRLTIRPASLEDGRVEYRSSDDDDDEIDSTGQKRWTKLNRSSSQVVGPVDGGGSREQDSEEDEGNYTLQIEVKRRKRGASKSEGCG
ncbi:CAMKK/ELM protein kinase [Phakopsora pachyrhizi]|nr:CAMKK/ELM protein kinase [Phakopsora pachyrhizi]